MRTPRVALTALAAVLAACGASPSAERAAASVTPVLVACGETACPWILDPGACQTVAEQRGLAGVFADAVIAAPEPGAVASIVVAGAKYTIDVAADGFHFDWAATRTVDFVMAQGQDGAWVYFYDPAVSGDTSLRTFLGRPLLGVNFCTGLAPLVVEKTAFTSATRTWTWSIAKSSTTTSLDPAVGETVQVPYTVTLGAASLDAGWLVTGAVTITNPTPVAAIGVEIVDTFAGYPVTPDCGTFEGTLAPGESVSCTYALPLPAAIDGVNVATVTTTGGPLGATATANVAFGAPTTVVDACVTVTDVPAGALGSACAGEGPNSFSYTLLAGPYETCGVAEPDFVNTATFVAPSGATGSASWSIPVQVACVSAGCTYTQGYWKTHSREGPAPYDGRWRNLGPLEEDTVFFLSGKTWLEVFRTPVRGNAYYDLAHQYMAAKLNVLAGASPAALGSALSTCEAFFSASGPGTPLGAAQRASLVGLASLLDQFNGGAIGPGHCGDGSGGGGGGCVP